MAKPEAALPAEDGFYQSAAWEKEKEWKDGAGGVLGVVAQPSFGRLQGLAKSP
jgi:hypothetical protein